MPAEKGVVVDRFEQGQSRVVRAELTKNLSQPHTRHVNGVGPRAPGGGGETQ